MSVAHTPAAPRTSVARPRLLTIAELGNVEGLEF